MMEDLYGRKFRKAYRDLYNMRIDFKTFAARIRKRPDEAMKLLTEYRKMILLGSMEDPRVEHDWN